MKRGMNRWMLRAAGAGALLVAVSLQAGDSDKKWYARADMGGTLMDNADVDQFVVSGAGEMEFTAGFDFGVAVGYHVTPWLGVEFQTGYTLNGVDSLNMWGFSQSMDASVMQLPFMVNVVYECNHCGKFVPFIGAGVGGMSSFFSVDDTVWVENAYVGMDGTGADIEFAYQFFGGLRYEINDRMGVGVLYRYSASQGPSWDVEDWYWDYTIGEIKLDDLRTHTFSLVFNAKF